VNGVEMILTSKNESSIRQISISRFLYDEIMEYISKLKGYKPDERLFYFSRKALQYDIKRVADKAGLPRIRVHDLRHSHASMLINMKVNIKEISERLGHESVKTTWDTYAHLYPDTDKTLADKLNEIRTPSDTETGGN
jgi:integrase